MSRHISLSRAAAALLGWSSLLALAACGNGQPSEDIPLQVPPPAATADASTPMGKRWEWVGTITPVERVEVEDPTRYTLRLQADGKVEFQFDCNRGSSSYELADNKLSFGPLLSTRMACPADTQDFVFMEQLGNVSSFFVNGEQLYLEMPYDSGTMRFRPAVEQH